MSKQGMLGPRKSDGTGVYCVLHSGMSLPEEACQGAGWGSTLSAPAVCSSEKKQKAKQPKVILLKKKNKTQNLNTTGNGNDVKTADI